MPIDLIINVGKNVQEKFKTYKIGDNEFNCFYKTSGLGHRRIIRNDNVLRLVADFISNIEI